MTGNQVVELNKMGSQVADALEACAWNNVPIGNKAILAQAIALLRADQHQGELLGYIWPEEIDGPNRCRVMTVSRPGDFMPNMIPVYQVPQLIQGEPVAWRYKTRVYVQALGYVWREVIETEAPNLNEVAARDLTTLYAHADHVEVAQMRERIKWLEEILESNNREYEKQLIEQKSLHGKLAIQGALLDRMAYYLSPALASHQYSMSHETMHDALAALHEWRQLKASAESAAPECNACNGSGYAHADGMPVTGACNTCHGKGVVDDGEISGSGGLPFANGPVKCVKDCPDCKS